MGERTSYEPGTFCWVELGTSDAAAAKGFYAQLFGWEAEDIPAGEGRTYTLLRLDGKLVAGLFEDHERPHPSWLSYVSVEDADAAVSRAAELGAEALQEPFDVMTIGRMAVLRDPTGAVFAVWQPRDGIGAEVVNDPGALTMNQLTTGDVEAAKSFYHELFGWRAEQVATGQQEFWSLYNGDNLNGGLMPLPPGGGVPAHWLAYFTTADIDASVARIDDHGGQVRVPPMEIPAGRICVAGDPQGAVFALFEGEVDP